MVKKWTYAIFFVLFLWFVSFLGASVFRLTSSGSSSAFTDGGNVMVIPLKGIIMGGSSESSLLSGSVVTSDAIIDALHEAQKDPTIKAVILDIDSGGGAAVPSFEIVQAIQRFNKTKIALIHSIGASGAYWVASACDFIMASQLSMVGSIGVTSSYLEYSGLLDKYNVSYERMVAGKYKDMGTPFRSLTPEEEYMFHEQLDKIHAFFIADVAKNRQMSIDEVKDLAEGQIFIGLDALPLGLIDSFGGMDEAKAYLESELNTTVSLRMKKEQSSLKSLLGLESGNFAYHFGRGFASEMKTASSQEIVQLQT